MFCPFALNSFWSIYSSFWTYETSFQMSTFGPKLIEVQAIANCKTLFHRYMRVMFIRTLPVNSLFICFQTYYRRKKIHHCWCKHLIPTSSLVKHTDRFSPDSPQWHFIFWLTATCFQNSLFIYGNDSALVRKPSLWPPRQHFRRNIQRIVSESI